MTGSAALYDRADAPGSSLSSLHAEVVAGLHGLPSVARTVAVRTLDEIAAEHDFGFVDLLKIDTEGSELAVLKGARQLLDRNAIGCVHFEFNEMNLVSRTYLRDFRVLLPEVPGRIDAATITSDQADYLLLGVDEAPLH